MTRQPRFDLVDIPHHVIQRGNNKQAIFLRTEDYRRYLEKLSEAAKKYQCEIHAYVLMTNHAHLLVTQKEPQGISRMMQALGRYYVRYFNYRYERTGTLWEGRYRATLVDSERYFLTCMRYIELNPVRAGMVAHPADYVWSSYQYHAFGELDTLITPHPQYESLGQTVLTRQDAYRRLFETNLPEKTVSLIRDTINKNGVLGSEQFYAAIQGMVHRPLYPLPRGGDRRSERYRIN